MQTTIQEAKSRTLETKTGCLNWETAQTEWGGGDIVKCMRRKGAHQIRYLCKALPCINID